MYRKVILSRRERRRNISLSTHRLVHMKIKFIRKHEAQGGKKSQSKSNNEVSKKAIMWCSQGYLTTGSWSPPTRSPYTNCVFYTHNLIFPAFLKGVYGKPSAILTWKKSKCRVCLNQMRAARALKLNCYSLWFWGRRACRFCCVYISDFKQYIYNKFCTSPSHIRQSLDAGM